MFGLDSFLFVAFGATVLVPLLVGIDPAVALCTLGVGTLLFHLITGGKVPVFLGSSFAFIAPIFIMVPAAATAPALVIVGVFMMSPLRKVDFDDMLSAIPAFVTLIMMPLTFSIAEGIIFGLLTHVVLHLATGKFKALSPFTIGLAALFVLKLAM